MFSNSLRFGDARPSIDGLPSQKVPLLWMTAKGNEKNPKGAAIYLSHKLGVTDWEAITAKEGQLKQIREGFFSAETETFFKPTHSFYLKSAYDSQKRRANDGQMFGYHVLPAGSKWQFDVVADNEQELKIATKALTGTQRIGRSRSAEFGLVMIEPFEDVTLLDLFTIQEKRNEVLLFAQSNICFLNKFGQNVLVPDAEMLQDFGFPPDSTISPKSKVRYRLYQSWNSKRFNRDHDRQIVEAGSVFIIRLPDNAPAFEVPPFIGSFQNEGFGAIQIDPEFLKSSSILLDFKLNGDSEIQEKFVEKQTPNHYYPDVETADTKTANEQLLSLLKQRLKRHIQYQDVDGVVNDFVKKNAMLFEQVLPSQWGVLRNVANGSNSDDILKKILFGFDGQEPIGFIYKGKSAGQWNKGAEKLKSFLFGDKQPTILKQGISVRELLTKLASQMSKERRKEVSND